MSSECQLAGCRARVKQPHQSNVPFVSLAFFSLFKAQVAHHGMLGPSEFLAMVLEI